MALIFDIKRYAINDGPGIRTTLFLKGCPLRCVWCHNPEGWSSRPQVLYKKNKCIGCQTCVNVCPENLLELTPKGIVMMEGCTLCAHCAKECPTTALEMCGREWSIEELMAEIEKERAVMEDSGGGVTLCGGEPLMHPDYVLQILKELGRRGFHRTVDTTLYASEEIVANIANECELFLVDLKLMDSEKHRLYTCVPNELILQNIRYLAEQGYNFVIRIPLIDGINADEANIEATALFLSTLPSNQESRPSAPLTVHLLPYHDVGKDKHRRMWSAHNPQNISMTPPSEETMKRCQQQFELHNIRVIIGG